MNALSLIGTLITLDSNAKSPTEALTNSFKPVIGAMLRTTVWETFLA